MKISLKIDAATGQKYIAVSQKGRNLLLDPLINKGTAFTAQERDELDLHGLLPPAVYNIHQQLDRAYENFLRQSPDIEKYIYLTNLLDRNETLFYKLVLEHIDEMMPIIYTPVVGEACQKYSHIYRKARGLYISYYQKEFIEKILTNARLAHPSVIVVTDGERILGLGDQGAGGMGISIGKLCLYTLCAGVSPYSTLPILLDVGTDNEERLNDPLYMGIRQKRMRGEAYQDFIDAFVEAVQKMFPHAVLQWEDFLKGNAIHQLKRFRNRLCTFNDDIQGTACVVLAGLLSALRITGKPLRNQPIVIAGAGAAAQGIADLLVAYLREEGLDASEAQRQIWTTDSKGLVTKARSGMEEFKAAYAREVADVAGFVCRNREKITLQETIENVKPAILIGTSAAPGIFTREIVERMAAINDRPIIFPLSNPTSKSECTAGDAIHWSDGRAIVATGSPYAPVIEKGKRYRIGQCNNAYVFPGIGLGLCTSQARHVSDQVFLEAARALADKVTAGDLDENAVYPELSRIRECSLAVACAVVRQVVKEGNADAAILEDLEENIYRAMWVPKYVPVRYEAPLMPSYSRFRI